jgi:hypothetical protein
LIEIQTDLKIKFMHGRILFPALTLFFMLTFSRPDATVLFSSVSQDSLFVGDRIHFGVIMLVPKGSQVAPPATDNGFGQFVVKEWTSDKSEKKSADSLSFNYILTTYSAERCTIPSLPFVQTTGSKTDTLRTEAFPMRVVLVPPPSAKDTAVIRDIKGIESVGTPSLLWLWLLAAALVLVLAFILLRRFRTKKTVTVPVVPPKPPYEEAIEAIRLLEEKQYVARGMIREYAFELSDIVKHYIERRYSVNAAEFTTEEMIGWVRVSPLEPAQRKTCEWFFSTTDPVKFAKWLPDSDTVSRFGADMRSFIEATRPVETQQGAKKQAEVANAPQ